MLIQKRLDFDENERNAYCQWNGCWQFWGWKPTSSAFLVSTELVYSTVDNVLVQSFSHERWLEKGNEFLMLMHTSVASNPHLYHFLSRFCLCLWVDLVQFDSCKHLVLMYFFKFTSLIAIGLFVSVYELLSQYWFWILKWFIANYVLNAAADVFRLSC